MVCLVRDVRTNEPKAIHRTALSLDGRKVEVDGSDRLSLGPVGGGAIKLTPDEDVTACLGVGEGVETTLDLRSAPEFGPSPVWSLISAGNLGKFPVLPAIETLWIAVDNDKSGTGQSDAQACAERWDAAGREVIQIIPSTLGADLNDVFTARRGRHV
jgi:putative DNA primase/helicase